MLVTYHVNTTATEIDVRAAGIAIEQSIEMPPVSVRNHAILDDVLGKVDQIDELAPDQFVVKIRFNDTLAGPEPVQLLNVLFGNTSMQPDVMLMDVDLPAAILAEYTGPRFGIAGLRELTGAYGRPLTCTALKPVGSSPEEFAALCRIFALGGIDIIKDDHGIADQAYAPFDARVRACQAAVDAVYAETGHRAIYAPNMLGGPGALRRQAELVREIDVRAVMIAPMLVGVSTFYELVTKDLRVPVLGHPAMGGAQRISPALLFGKLYRLFGADAVIYLNYGGRFQISEAMCTQLAANLREPWGHLRPSLPTPAGGMTVDRVDEIVDFYGDDVMLLVSGGLLTAGDQILERSQEFVTQAKKS